MVIIAKSSQSIPVEIIQIAMDRCLVESLSSQGIRYSLFNTAFFLTVLNRGNIKSCAEFLDFGLFGIYHVLVEISNMEYIPLIRE